MLPNLSALPLATGAQLFQYVAVNGGGKSKCRAHKEPIVTDDDGDPEKNCAVDGYLMFKPVPGATAPGKYPYGEVIDVDVDGTPMRLRPLLKRSSSSLDRKQHFEIMHPEWIEKTFPVVCDRGAGLQPVTWQGYGAELATITEWFFLDGRERGHLFVQLLNSEPRKKKFHMPYSGVFKGDYLYIALVCASGGQGYGKTLMKLAEGAAKALGCTGIALASLSNSAGFYYSQGFSFVSKEDGMKVDVTPWTERIVGADGSRKTLLKPAMDVPMDPPTGPPTDPPGSVSSRTRGRRQLGKAAPPSLQAAA